MEFWSAMCYVVSALFLFSDPYHSTWLGFLTVGAVVQVYASFMIDYQCARRQRRRKTPMWSVKNIKMSRRKEKTESNRRIIE